MPNQMPAKPVFNVEIYVTFGLLRCAEAKNSEVKAIASQASLATRKCLQHIAAKKQFFARRAENENQEAKRLTSAKSPIARFR